MKRLSVFLSVIILFSVFVGGVDAEVLTVDDVTAENNAVVYEYGGFIWNKINVIHKNFFKDNFGINSGYENGVVSGGYVAVNKAAETATVIKDDEPFDFNGVFLAAAWNNALNINVVGKLNGVEKYNRTVTVDVDFPTWFDFNFLGIDELVFSSSGGTNAGFGWRGEHFVMDNFTFNESAQTPEPTCLSRKIQAASKLCTAYMGCYAKEIEEPGFYTSVFISAFLAKAEEIFGSSWDEVEAEAAAKGDNCATAAFTAIEDVIVLGLEEMYKQISDGLDLRESNARKLGQALLKAVGEKCTRLLKAESENIEEADSDKLHAAIFEAESKLAYAWNWAMTEAWRQGVTYMGPSMAEVEGMIDDLVTDVIFDM